VGATSADASKYQQVSAELRRRIEAGSYTSGELPSTAMLAHEFGVAVKTVQRALLELDHAGLTAGRQGRQRFVLRGEGGAAGTRYEQVAADVLRDIRSGALPAGGRVPPESDLATKYGASRATVRESLGLLESAGHVVKRAGRRYVAGTNERSDLAYERVALVLRSAIKSARYPSGKLPGENQLATEHGVSRPTIRQALIRLQEDGLIYPAPKQGWFMTDSAMNEGAQ
jgi:DNA-binding GntR family transcriptional regulator